METLKEVDAVAYVRFASVYRDFRETKDFENFLGEMDELPKPGPDAAND
jgi:transcriptional repressor NrdR